MASARARSMMRSVASGSRRASSDRSSVAEPEFVERMAERLERRLGQAQVGPDIEVRDECRFLVDGHDAAAAGFGRGVGRALPAADGDRAGVRPDGPGQDLDEGALAGAVGAHQRVDLARADGKRCRAQGDDGAVRLGDARRLEQEVRGERSS